MVYLRITLNFKLISISLQSCGKFPYISFSRTSLGSQWIGARHLVNKNYLTLFEKN